MPLNRQNQKYMMRGLYAGQLENVQLLKRNPNQQMGTVTAFQLYGVRWSRIHKSGEIIDGEVQSSHPRRLHIPEAELNRVGVTYIDPADRFVDEQGRTWQPEATTTITQQLFRTHFCCDCLRVPEAT